jgi:hypothetical protein
MLAMHRLIPVVAVATALLGAATAGSAIRSTAPTLKLVQRAPLQLRGLAFKAKERVRVHATAGQESEVRVTRTSHHGAFVVDFGQFPSNPCLRVTVKAAGAKGDHGTLVIEPAPLPEIPCGV